MSSFRLGEGRRANQSPGSWSPGELDFMPDQAGVVKPNPLK
jgi:hypothetical protein